MEDIFDTISIGDVRSVQKHITLDDVKKFVELTGDNNPLHTDHNYASSTSFKDIVVHGLLGASLLSTVIGTKLPGEGALWVSQNFNFLVPIRLNDTLTATAEVVAKHSRDRLLDLKTRIVNQDGLTVVDGHGTVKVAAQRSVANIERKLPPRVALVTGASGGIGQKICYGLARDGFNIVAAYNKNRDRAEAVAQKIENEFNVEAHTIKSDLSTEHGVSELIDKAHQKFGCVTALVNNASMKIVPRPLSEDTWHRVNEHFDIQVRAAFLLAQAFLHDMKTAQWGRIVNITSDAALSTPVGGWAAYAISKGALQALTATLSAELGVHGITTNSVSPGLTETPMIGNFSEKSQLIFARQNPMRRLGQPSDVASAVSYLLSNEASYINGQTIHVNGGAYLG